MRQLRPLKEFFEQLSSIGVSTDMRPRHQISLRLTNHIVILACAMSIVQAIAMLGSPIFSGICFASLPAYCLTFVLHGKKYPTLSRIYFSGISCAIILVATASMTDEINVAYRFMILQAFVIPLVVFDRKEDKGQTLAILFFIISFAIYDQMILTIPAIDGFDDSIFVNENTIVLNGVLCMITLWIGSRYLHGKSERALVKLNEKMNVMRSNNHELQKDKDEINASIIYADSIQRGMMPSKDRLQRLFSEHHLYTRDGAESTGDFLWIGHHEGKVVIATMESNFFRTTEVLMSIICSMCLENIVHRLGITEPKEILTRMSDEIRLTLKDQWKHVYHATDICVCTVDTKAKTLQYSGTIEGVVVRNGKELIRPLVTNNNVRAEGKRITEFYQHTIRLKEDSRLYMHTSGLSTVFADYSRKKDQPIDLIDVLLKNKDYTVDLQLSCIAQSINHCGHAVNVDEHDLLLFGIELDLTEMAERFGVESAHLHEKKRYPDPVPQAVENGTFEISPDLN